MRKIEIKNLYKTLGGVSVLNNINLDFESGKIYGIYGDNGSGKTMLFRVICGLVKPTKGEIILDGKKLHEDISFYNNLGALIETPGFWDYYTGYENLAVLASIKKIISKNEIIEVLKRVGLDPHDKRPYRKYSLGMKQRLGIAQAIMEKPDIIILDEPTNAIDESGVNNIRSLIKEENERGATILIASHNKDDINILSDLQIKISKGSIVDIH